MLAANGGSTMTREEVLKIVSEAREKGERANLTRADLRWADQSDADLTEADLTDADLRWACLYDATMPHRYIQIGPIGSRKDQIVYNADLDQIHVGCFRGTLDEFENSVRKNHRTNIHAREYLATVRYLQEMREIQKTAVKS